MTLGVVIPVYRGKDTIGTVVEKLFRFAGEQRLLCRVVLVEDCSKDGSREAVLKAAADYGGVTAILLNRNVGQQQALYYGLNHVRDCDLVATMDDDGQHPVPLLKELRTCIEKGADLCYAVPVRKGYPLYRKAGSVLRDMLFSLCTGKPKGVRVSAYRMITGELAGKLKPERDGFIYLSAAAFRLHPRTSCIFYEAGPSDASSYTFGKLLRLYWNLLIHYTPLKVFHSEKDSAQTCPYTVLPGRGFLWEP